MTTRRVTTPGALALLGGGEHQPPCAPIDRWLLDRTGRSAPHVLVLPVASLPVSLAATAALARNWWHRLGVSVRVVVPHRHPTAEVLDAVAAADLIVLPGGVPERLLAELGASPIAEAILARWRHGAALAGSSAGAMALFAWRLRIASWRPLTLTPGLGALDGHVAVPHWERFVGHGPARHRFAERHRGRLRGLGILGLDESTALVLDSGGGHVLGAGTVTIGDADGWRRHRPGDDVAIDLRVLPTATRSSRVPREPLGHDPHTTAVLSVGAAMSHG